MYGWRCGGGAAGGAAAGVECMTGMQSRHCRKGAGQGAESLLTRASRLHVIAAAKNLFHSTVCKPGRSSTHLDRSAKIAITHFCIAYAALCG
jgi:hypothetical protein